MKTISNEFREALRGIREIDTKITYKNNGVDTIIENETIKSVNPLFKVDLFRTICKSVQIESQQDIPLKTWINLEIGVLVNNNYEYLDFGKYYIIDSTFQADTNTYLITAYDKMIESMIKYDENPLEITYPISVKQMIIKICEKLNWTYNLNTFVNDDKLINKDLFSGLGLTYRDILDNLSEVAVGNLTFDNNDNLIIKYIDKNNPTNWNENQVVTEEDLKSVNVDIKTKYGKVNTLLISSNNVVLNNISDEQSVTQNGKTEIKIDDNLILIFENEQFIEEMFDYVNGLEFYLYDFDTIGLLFLEPLDKFAVRIDNVYYPTICLNDDIKITSGLVETLYVEEPEINVNEYVVNDKETSKLNQTAIRIDKQNQEIQALASKIIELSTTKTGKGQVKFESATLGALDKLSITGNVHLIYPSSDKMGGMEVKSGIYKSGTTKSSTYKFVTKALYPSNNLYPLDTYLIIKQEDKEVFRKRLPIKELNSLDNISDEFVWQYNKMKIIRRIGVATNGDYYILPNEFEEDLGELEIIIPEGDGYFVFESFPNSTISITYMLKNEYTETFSTKVETKAEIKVATDKINLEVGEQFEGVNKDIAQNEKGIVENKSSIDIMSKQIVLKSTANGKLVKAELNADAENGTEFNVKADNINLEGYTTINDGFAIDKQGNMKCNNATMNDITISGGNVFVENDGVGSSNGTPDRIWVANSYDYEYQGNGMGTSIFSDWFSMQNNQKRCYINMDIRESTSVINVTDIGNQSGSDIQSNGIWSPAFNPSSLESKKKNIELDDGCLQQILETDICSYNWNFEDDGDQKHIGAIIANNGGNYKIAPKVLTHDKDAIDLYSMTGMAWKGIQELYNIVIEQQEKIKELEERLNGITESN